MIITDFAKRYAEAWCSQNPDRVAASFAENGSLKEAQMRGHPAIADRLKRAGAIDFADGSR